MPAPQPLRNARLENHLEAFFHTQIRRAGGMCIKLVPLDAGLPDRLVLLPPLPGERRGRTFLVELKADDGTLSPIQRVWHQRAHAMGHPVHTVYGRDGIYDWLEDVLP
jgi:hypothetical protein